MARYGTGVLVGKAWSASFPLGTMLINIVGSVAMGLFIGYLVRTTPAWQADARLFVAIGVLGGFTTFSSFSLDAVSMLERGELGLALFYVLGSVIIGIAALFAGLVVMRVGA
jgi:CrcB protein